jgi:hypothetical protein
MLLLNGTINIIENLSEKTYPYFTTIMVYH